MYGGQRLQLKDTSREGAVGRAVALVCVYGGLCLPYNGVNKNGKTIAYPADINF
jgi:hypothetical protein